MNSMDKRHFKRIYFSDEDSIEAVFRLSDEPSEPIKGQIMNLSEGGLFISVSKDTKPEDMGEGVHLILKEITGITPFLNIDNTEIEIKWILHAQFLENVGLGCEFVNITEDTRNKIRQIVASSEQ